MKRQEHTLPLKLGDGLEMRQVTAQDIDELGEFNVRIHSDDRDAPEKWLAEWTRDLLAGEHPTANPSCFIAVVDHAAGGKIISSVGLIPQRWRYEEIPFGVGRPDLIGTHENYRRRGLVRRQMQIVHAWSEASGHLAQVITGIPHYYRRFGYEMALTLGGSRLFALDRLRKLQRTQDDQLRVRAATGDDVPLLDALYERHCAASMVSRVRDESEWRYEMEGAHEDSQYRRTFRLVENTDDGEVLGYFEFAAWPGQVAVREIAAAPGRSLRQVALMAVYYLKELGEQSDNAPSKTASLTFALGSEHPAYRALERELVSGRQPYGWYVRVPDLPSFVQRIAPVLERRIAESVVCGYRGALRLNCTDTALELVWDDGKLRTVNSFQPNYFHDGDAFFPGLSFLQLMMGFRDLDELHHAYPDCYSDSDETYVVLSALFPRKPSSPVGLG